VGSTRDGDRERGPFGLTGVCERVSAAAENTGAQYAAIATAIKRAIVRPISSSLHSYPQMDVIACPRLAERSIDRIGISCAALSA
jgi:hypothetical protein